MDSVENFVWIVNICMENHPDSAAALFRICEERSDAAIRSPLSIFPPASDFHHPTNAVGDDAHIVPHRFAFFTPFRL